MPPCHRLRTCRQARPATLKRRPRRKSHQLPTKGPQNQSRTPHALKRPRRYPASSRMDPVPRLAAGAKHFEAFSPRSDLLRNATFCCVLILSHLCTPGVRRLGTPHREGPSRARRQPSTAKALEGLGAATTMPSSWPWKSSSQAIPFLSVLTEPGLQSMSWERRRPNEQAAGPSRGRLSCPFSRYAPNMILRQGALTWT